MERLRSATTCWVLASTACLPLLPGSSISLDGLVVVDSDYSFELINADERLLLWLLVLLQQEGPGDTEQRWCLTAAVVAVGPGYMEQIEVDGALQKQVPL